MATGVRVTTKRNRNKRREAKRMQQPQALAQHVVSERERTGQGTMTAERILKAGPDGVETTPANVQRVIAAPLDRLWKRGEITQREYDAGDTFRTDAHIAAIDPGAPSVDWNRAGGGNPNVGVPSMFTSQTIADARSRWRRISDRIPERSVVSTILFLGLIRETSLEEIGRSVFGLRDAKDAALSGKAGFRVALASLADHYGA
jgi:hypothetical protein